MLERAKTGTIKGTSKIEKFYRFYCIVAKVKVTITREISGFPFKKVGYFGASFLCIIWHVVEYFSIFGKKKDEGLKWWMAFEKTNMHFWVNWP